MSMSYKEDLNRLAEYLTKEKDSLARNGKWDKSKVDHYEELEEYRRAIFGALDTIKYYEERETILKAQRGSEFIEKLDQDWFAMRKALINERLGIGFEQQENQEPGQKENDGHEVSN